MIDKQIQQELRLKFNPDESQLRQHQLRMLKMLCDFDAFCKSNDIQYWLTSGTLLGAVRHGGFIPWDDDADIGMLRKDYKKLKLSYSKTKGNTKFILQTHKTDFYYFAPYAKIRDTNSIIKEDNTNVDLLYKYRGIFIDVFIFEPSSSKWIAKISSVLHNRLLLHALSKIKSDTFRSVYYRGMYVFLYKFVIPILKNLSTLGPRNVLRHTLGSGFIKKRYYEDIFPLSTLSFEGKEFHVPHNYDKYLRGLYGDYTILPKIDSIEKHTINLKMW